MKALVVEDDRKVARLLARVLQEEGYVVDTCASGSDAEQQASSIAYELVVLDWMLPEGDGLGGVPRAAAQGFDGAHPDAHRAR